MVKTASARRASLLQQVRDSGLPDALAGRVAVHEALTVYEVSWQEDWDNCGWRTMLAARRHQLATVHRLGRRKPAELYLPATSRGLAQGGERGRDMTGRLKRTIWCYTWAGTCAGGGFLADHRRRAPCWPTSASAALWVAPATANPAGTMTTKRRRARRASCARERRRPRRRTEQSVSAGRTSRTEH